MIEARDGQPGQAIHRALYATGASRNQNIPSQASTIASATPHPMASKKLALSDIGNSFGSAPRARCSSKLRSLTAPTVVATNSVAHSKLAKASDREGV